MNYPGGKAKTFQHVINLMPPHKVYIEPFLGAGSVIRSKKPASLDIGIDLDNRITSNQEIFHETIKLINEDGISFLESYNFEGHEVIYCDPPYLPSTRKQKRVYKYDLDEAAHLRLLDVLVSINANIIISGYSSPLYEETLNNWNLYTYRAKAHDGIRDECLWYNFKKPEKLHDYRYLGDNFRERQTIQRRLDRTLSRLESLTPQERSFISEWLLSKGATNAA